MSVSEASFCPPKSAQLGGRRGKGKKQSHIGDDLCEFMESKGSYGETVVTEQDHSGWRLMAKGKCPSFSTQWYFQRNLPTNGMLVYVKEHVYLCDLLTAQAKRCPSSNQSLRIRSTKCIRENLCPQQLKIAWGLCSLSCFRGFMKQLSKRAGLQRAPTETPSNWHSPSTSPYSTTQI